MERQNHQKQKTQKPDKLLIFALIFAVLMVVLVGVVAFQTRDRGMKRQDDTEVPVSEAGKNEPELDPAFAEKLSDLATTYGVFADRQTGMISSTQNQWFAPAGLLGAVVQDLDSDSEPELLVSIAQPCDHNLDGVCHVLLQVYEQINGQIFLADEAIYGAYFEDEETWVQRGEFVLPSDYSMEEYAAAKLIPTESGVAIFCEDHNMAGAYGDGMFRSYWIMEYKDHDLRYVCSYTQVDGGSAEFTYRGYRFEKGVCVDSNLYYTEIYDYKSAPLYDHFGKSIISFFETYGVQLDERLQDCAAAHDGNREFRSILAPKTEAEILFELTNTILNVSDDYAEYTFAAELHNGNNLLEQAGIQRPISPVLPLYEGSQLVVTGTLTERDYEINSNNKGTVMILELDQPLTKALYSEWLGYSGEVEEISEMQIGFSEWLPDPPVVGQHVALIGDVMYQNTGHHLTTVLLMDAWVRG